MLVNIGQSQPLITQSGTYEGVFVNAYIVAASANTALAISDFKPAGIQLEVNLVRGGKTYTLYNNNMLLIGTYCGRRNNLQWFLNGYDIVLPASSVYAVKLRTSFAKFASPVTLFRGDSLQAIVTNNTSAWSSNVNTSNSYAEFLFKPTGKQEFGVPQVVFEVINTNASDSQNVNANGVREIQFLNFDQTTLGNQVIASASISSDKMNASYTFNQLLGREAMMYKENIPYQFATSLPASPTAPTVPRALDFYPQSLQFLDLSEGYALNNCVLHMNYNSANVNASQNYVGSTRLIITPQAQKSYIALSTAVHNKKVALIAQGGMS